MDPTDPNTGIPMYDSCHMYPGGSDLYSACTANGGTLPVDTSSVPTPWFDQAWFPITLIVLLVVIAGSLGYMAYARKTAK